MIRTALLELLDHAIEIGIAGAKAPCEPVSAALGNSLAVSNYLELSGLARGSHGFNTEALLDQGHETRDLSFVVLSRRAVNDLDLHSVLICSQLDNRMAQSFVEPWDCKSPAVNYRQLFVYTEPLG
jgi:hypothetical protein